MLWSRSVWALRAPFLAWLFMDSFSNISIMSWNIRGASSKHVRRHVRDLIRRHHPTICCIYETHVPFSRVEKFWSSLGYRLLFSQEAHVHSGGIWILTCTMDITFTLIDTMRQAITFELRIRHAYWYCTSIYASPSFANRCSLWDHLMQVRGSLHGPWVLLGDFNEILYSFEVSGGNFLPSRASLLATMMTSCNLMDLQATGGLFTWRKNIQFGGHIRKKLDRIMVDVDWQLAFPQALVQMLPQHGSDHNPLLLSCDKFKVSRAKLFYFQAAWMNHPEYESLVQSSWTKTTGGVNIKLDAVRKQSLIFNRETFGNIFKRKRQIEARINGVHQELDSFPTSTLITLERDLQEQYSAVLKEEELLWFQKSRENWIKFGNRNTKFYHAQTVVRRRRNYVTGLQIDGTWCYDAETLKRGASQFFKKLFLSSDHCDPTSLHLRAIPKIPPELSELLTRPVLEGEVKEALFSMDPYKAPGPDGFQPVFFRNYWHVISKDIWFLVATAFATGAIEPALAETLIVPIPKVDEP